ncbi:hypothetical protein PG994_004703 [Apiospora phragmitis]|uniref:Uncharacterized protein n=1 Tax=Apiospora phragmitis TaxID=2905665 RepID=A0ABR1VV70_9PEZI
MAEPVHPIPTCTGNGAESSGTVITETFSYPAGTFTHNHTTGSWPGNTFTITHTQQGDGYKTMHFPPHEVVPTPDNKAARAEDRVNAAAIEWTSAGATSTTSSATTWATDKTLLNLV